MSNVNSRVVKMLNQGWPKRATVCAMAEIPSEAHFDPARPDYPTRMVPFLSHPKFQRLDEAVKSDVLTWGWMGYNERTITAEDSVVNPALHYIATQLLGRRDWTFHEAIRQTLVDEHYHSLMHMRAMESTRSLRGLTRDLTLPKSVTYRRLLALQAELTEPWQRSLAAVAFATVAEISVNAFLDILADDETIQPAHRAIAQMHNRDEYAHSKVLGEISKVLYDGFDAQRRAFFVKALPEALHAFVAQDFSMWEAILTQLEVPDAHEIIADSRSASNAGVIMRDYSGLRRFAEEAGFLGDMEFDFTGTVAAEQGVAN
jgi:hypothetical protein